MTFGGRARLWLSESDRLSRVPPPLCPVGRCVQSVLKQYIEQFQAVLENQMDKVTVADVLKEVRSPARG